MITTPLVPITSVSVRQGDKASERHIIRLGGQLFRPVLIA